MGQTPGLFAAFTNLDGSLAGGVNHYDGPDDFRQQFEHHLRDRLDKMLETLPDRASPHRDSSIAPPPRWTDSPYPGLAAFAPEQAPIFFGRGAEVDQLLQPFADPQVRFVAVVGVSGSGKSSLVLAGLLPRLRAGIVGTAPWVDLRFKPGERGGDPFLALAYALKSALGTTGQTEDEMARAFQVDASVVQKQLSELIGQDESAGELLLAVDQFEELFTQATADQVEAFLGLLDHLVAQPRLRVIVTLRADFYGRAIGEATLARLLRRDGGTFPLDPPSMSALHEMIVRPAEAAGVELEEGLAQRLLDEAGAGPGAMALIAFTLNQLYERAPDRHLNIETYEAFGGVRGAVQQRAEAALQGLPVNTDRALPPLFAQLVEVNEQEVATRRRAPQAALHGDTKTVAMALTEARLLVSGEGEDRQATLEVAHETVLSGWERLRDWISDHAESLRARRDLERVAMEWDKSGRHGGALRTGKLLRRYLSAATPRSATAEDYLGACNRRLTLMRVGYGVLGLLAIVTLGILFHVNKSAYPPTFAAKALFVQLGIWPVSRPQMVTIPAGEFERGDLIGDGQSDERPVRTVRFAQTFEMGQFEVTFDEYDLFAAATGRSKPGNEWGQEFRGVHPVINVSWDDAVAYTVWISKRTGVPYRLPTEAEWEYAARAKTKTVRYWPENADGEDDAACAYANVFDAKNESRLKATYNITWEPFNCADDYPFTAPVGQFTPNAWQLYDMLGNVWEWVQDCYNDSYEDAPADGSPREPADGSQCARRVLRGGSWLHVPLYVRSANRFRNAPDFRSDNFGFRLARTL